VYETKIRDIDDLRKRLMQTCFDVDRNIIDAAWPCEIMRACWWWTLWTPDV